MAKKKVLLITALAILVISLVVAIPASANNVDPGEIMAHGFIQFLGSQCTPWNETWAQFTITLKKYNGPTVGSTTYKIYRTSGNCGQYGTNAYSWMDLDERTWYVLEVSPIAVDGTYIKDVHTELSYGPFYLGQGAGADIHFNYNVSWSTAQQGFYETSSSIWRNE